MKVFIALEAGHSINGCICICGLYSASCVCVPMSKECKRRTGLHVVVTETTEAVFIRPVALGM